MCRIFENITEEWREIKQNNIDRSLLDHRMGHNF
jgi:hypothetical protein